MKVNRNQIKLLFRFHEENEKKKIQHTKFQVKITLFSFQWVEAMQKFTEAAELIDAESRMKKTM